MSTSTPDRTERKRDITRWNRRLGWALLVAFPVSYLTGWADRHGPDGSIGSWLSFLNVGFQVVAFFLLMAHAAYSFYVFGFPSPRANLRSLNGYVAYLVLLIYLLSQSATNLDPQFLYLSVASFILIGLHVMMAAWLAYRRPKRETRKLRQDVRALLSPDAELLDEINGSIAHGRRPTDVPVLSAKNVDVTLGSVQVLFGVDLEVQPGEVVALMGNNGAGKTTTLRTLSGLQACGSGSVTLDGFDVTRLTAAGRAELGLSLIIGGRAVFGPLTVRENLEMYAYRLQLSPRETAERIGAVTQAFPWMRERSGQLASTLSGGEQQMLAVSQALLLKPRILLIDEFSLGLAPKIVGQLIELVHTISAQGTAVLIVEQSASVAFDVATRVYVMERGRIVLAEDSDVLRRSPERLSELYLQGSTAEAAV